MSKENSSATSLTDWDRLRAMGDDDIDLSDIPEATPEEMNRGRLLLGGKPVPPGMVLVPLEADLVERFKAQADRDDYHVLINAALRAAI